MKQILKLFLLAAIVQAGCQDNDGSDNSGDDSDSPADVQTTDSSIASDSQTPDTEPLDTSTADVLSVLCENLTEEECQLNNDCLPVSVRPTNWDEEQNLLVVGCMNSDYFGCTKAMDCSEESPLALNPFGECRFLNHGCLPKEAGWQLATDEITCRPPVAHLLCID
ncbi:MAG: hypothetical protein JXR76_19165 [Deltaproteobacteria bacterium]|nr:hypothetical protein [Deltaproteobacteria bacterium]